jgi:pimeloyl-ACP methyl ester carboxylesterase
MLFEVTEHTVKSARHTTGYLACGGRDAPLLIFVHGWPELSLSWRHQLPVFAALGFRCVAPDMRGYGRSSSYSRHEDFAQSVIVQDMIELLAALGRDTAVWIGHDWGGPVVWNMASHHPERTAGVVGLCVPYIADGFTLDTIVPLVDRSVYPPDEYPVGQWDYQLNYVENFDATARWFEDNVSNVIALLFRRGDPAAVGRPTFAASIRKSGGWFGGGPCPDLGLDTDVITEQDHDAYTAALTRTGFFGPDSWYMNHAANRSYARTSVSNGQLSMPALFLHAAYDTVCETVHSRLAEPMRRDCADLTEVVVPSGHWMAQEQPVAVNAALSKWLATKLPDYWPH